MGSDSLKKLSSRKKKRSKASNIKIGQDDIDRKKSSGNLHNAETTSDEHSETSPSDRAKPDKNASIKERGVPRNIVAVYTPRTPKTPQEKRAQKSAPSDTSSGSKSGEKVIIDKKKDKQAPSKKIARPHYSSEGTNDTSSRKQRRKKLPKKSDNKSDNKPDAKKAEPKADNDGKKAKKKGENVLEKKRARSAECISSDVNRDDSKKQIKRKKKLPKKDEQAKDSTGKSDDQKPATPQVTPPKEVTVMAKPDDPTPISQFFQPQMKEMAVMLAIPVKVEEPKPVKIEEPKPVKVEESKPIKLEDPKPIKQDHPKQVNPKPAKQDHPKPIIAHPIKEDNTDDDLNLSELRTCSMLRSPVLKKQNASPVHKNKKV